MPNVLNLVAKIHDIIALSLRMVHVMTPLFCSMMLMTLLLPAGTTGEAAVLVTFHGTVEEVPIELRPTFQSGQAVLGVVTFDNDRLQAPDPGGNDPNLGAYPLTVTALRLQIGSYISDTTAPDGFGIAVVHNNGPDGDALLLHGTFRGPDMAAFTPDIRPYNTAVLLELIDRLGTAFQGDSLPDRLPVQFVEHGRSRLRVSFSDGLYVATLSAVVTVDPATTSEAPRARNDN